MRTILLLLSIGIAAAQSGSNDLVETLFSFDKNKDGKLSKDEVPERMQGIFARADADKDGLLTREEVVKATASQERRGPGGPPMDLLFRTLDADQDGTVSAAEIAAAPMTLKKLDKNGDGALTADEVRPQMMMRGRGEGFGRGEGRGEERRGNPQEMSAEFFNRFDLNHDGVISKEEVAKAFENMGGRR